MAEKFNTNAPLVWEDAVTDTGTRQRYPLGMKREEDGKTYRYYKYDDSAVASAAGHICTHVPGTAGSVTSDITDSHQNLPAGVAQAVVADGSYGWFQTQGRYATVLTDGGDDIAAGDVLIVDASVDGAVDSVAAGTDPTHVVVGVATAADVDASNTVAAFLTIE